MYEFHATAVEVYAEDGVLTVHFDDQADHYLQLQAPEIDDPVEFEPGYGNVYVEVGTQLHSGFNCFSLAELSRDHFRLVLARDETLTRIGEVVVTLSLDDAAFREVRDGLTRAFRAFPDFRSDGCNMGIEYAVRFDAPDGDRVAALLRRLRACARRRTSGSISARPFTAGPQRR